ncbi:hypothetical protein BGZ51_005117 [Haplosporangium sp. Z 767]|nr:hypothetical protein BGZ51_005117 [Haplosporangium sp. Z 767]KAF9188313.1 hypothetical protein BGZ50_001428 [Haplosporangium sp. Z 11]
MYDFCAKYNINHHQVTKWVVGQNESDLEYLENLSRKAHGLLLPTKRFPDPPTFMLTQRQMLAKEPHVSGKAALVSPRTGIVDVHGLMQLLEMKIQDHGGDIAFQCEVIDIERIGGNRSWSITGDTNINTKEQGRHQEHRFPSAHPAGGGGFRVRMNSPAGVVTVKAATVVNSAGLHSDRIYNMILSSRATTRESSDSEKPPLQLHYCKGHYYGYSGPSLVSRLIYPVPDKNLTSLGTHLTLDLAGRMRFGPDVLYIDRLDDYTIDPETVGSPSSLETVSKIIQTYLPAIKPSSLYVDYAGIRPKLAGPGESFRDFMIEDHDGFVHLVGIESPGLTSSLAIAEYVEKMLY